MFAPAPWGRPPTLDPLNSATKPNQSFTLPAIDPAPPWTLEFGPGGLKRVNRYPAKASPAGVFSPRIEPDEDSGRGVGDGDGAACGASEATVATKSPEGCLNAFIAGCSANERTEKSAIPRTIKPRARLSMRSPSSQTPYHSRTVAVRSVTVAG